MTVRLGFCGAGFIADYHAGMLELSGADATITAVHDPAPGRAESFCARHGGTPVATEHEVFDACDAVYICTWTSEHPRLVAAAAGRGLAVFCEKPLATDLASARRLAASAAGVVNQVGLVLRDSPAFLLLRAMVADPADGEVLTVVFRDDQYLPTRGQYRSDWRGDPARAGAGTLLEHSIHDLDLLEWLFGTAVALSARTAHHHGIDGIEDVASVNVEFASGATAHLTSVWHDVLGRPSQRRMEVFRRRGWYCLEGDVFGPVRWTRSTADEVAAADAGPGCAGPADAGPDDATGDGQPGWMAGAVTEPDSLDGDALVAELGRRGIALRFPDAGFVDAVAHRRPATPDLAVAVRAHVLADAAYRSAANGGLWVDIEPPGGT